MEITIKIEPFQKPDIAEVLRIQTENNLGRWQPQDYFDELKREDSISFTAKNNERIAGFVISRLITTKAVIDKSRVKNNKNNKFDFDLESEIEIYNLAVDKKYRQGGVGTLLIQKVIQTAKKNCLASIWLEVRESNSAAISFYKKNKFKEIYRRKNFYNYPQEDALVMKLDFFEDVENSQKKSRK